MANAPRDNDMTMPRARLFFAIFVVLGIAMALAACGAKKSKPPLTPTAADEDAGDDGGDEFGGAFSDGGAMAEGEGGAGEGEQGAKSLLDQFVKPGADHAALTKSLRPTSADYGAMFDDKTAPLIESAQVKDWETGKFVIAPKPKQTEVKLFGATGADLAAGKGNAAQFPGGYKKVAPHLKGTVTFYAFKFVAPGTDKGEAYDGLAFVNGHWVIAPKPWRGAEGAGGGGGDGGGKPAKGKKPKKPKKK